MKINLWTVSLVTSCASDFSFLWISTKLNEVHGIMQSGCGVVIMQSGCGVGIMQSGCEGGIMQSGCGVGIICSQVVGLGSCSRLWGWESCRLWGCNVAVYSWLQTEKIDCLNSSCLQRGLFKVMAFNIKSLTDKVVLYEWYTTCCKADIHFLKPWSQLICIFFSILSKHLNNNLNKHLKNNNYILPYINLIYT